MSPAAKVPCSWSASDALSALDDMSACHMLPVNGSPPCPVSIPINNCSAPFTPTNEPGVAASTPSMYALPVYVPSLCRLLRV